MVLPLLATTVAVTGPALAAWPSLDWPDLEARSSLSGWRDLRWPDLVRTCGTVTAFDDVPTPAALEQALARVGSRGRARLDLTLPQAGRIDDPEDGAAKAPPKWQNPLAAARTVAGAKRMTSVKEMVLDGYPLTVEAAAILAASENLGALARLSLSRTRVSGPALQVLLAPEALPALVELDLTNNPLRAADLEALAARLAERKVAHLELGARDEGSPGFRMGRLAHDPAAVAALAKIAGTPSLSKLGLNLERVGFAELEALLSVPRTQPLEIELARLPALSQAQMTLLATRSLGLPVTLSILDLGTTPAHLKALERSGLLAKVSSLGLRCGDACARILERSPHVGHLRTIVFGCEETVDFTAKTGAALARAAGLAALRELSFLNDVEVCKAEGLGPEGLRALLAAPFAGQLEALAFADQGLGGAGHLALAKATSLSALKRLALSDEEPILDAENIRFFFRDGALAPHLEYLRLGNESIAGWPLAELAKGLRMPNLRVLELPYLDATEADWLWLFRAPGWNVVQVLSLPSLHGAKPHDRLSKAIRVRLAADACVW